MKESQERRERQKRQQKGLERSRSDVIAFDSDEDIHIQSAARRKRGATRFKEGMQDFVALTAPQRSLPPHRRRKSLMINDDATLAMPGRSARKQKGKSVGHVEISESEEENSLDELSPIPSSSLPSRQNSQRPLMVQVPMTSSKTKRHVSRDVRSSPPTSTSSMLEDAEEAVQVIAGSSAETRSSQKGPENLLGTQAIADSQPDRRADVVDIQPPNNTVPSSMPPIPLISRPSYSSFMTTKVMSTQSGSSLPRPPPLSSPPPVNIVISQHPSSPPVVYSEHSAGESEDDDAQEDEDDADVSYSLDIGWKEAIKQAVAESEASNSSNMARSGNGSAVHPQDGMVLQREVARSAESISVPSRNSKESGMR